MREMERKSVLQRGTLLRLVGLLLVLWATRWLALDALPLHNDEGLHLTRALAVWDGHPFWAISDGKIVNHWLIAALVPQSAPVIAGRAATILVALVGFSAGYTLLWRRFGERAALLGGALWIAAPYLFFFERLAFSDAQAGALVVVTLWAALTFTRSGRLRDAVLTGLALGVATLFKFTAAPYALGVLLVIALAGDLSARVRWRGLAAIAVTGAACFVVPLAYVLVKEGGFETAFGWLGGGGDGGALDNLRRLWNQLVGFQGDVWAVLLIGGLALFVALQPGGRDAGLLALAWALPLLVIVVLGKEVQSRHFVVALPLALLLAGAGLSAGLERLPRRAALPIGAVLIGVLAVQSGVVMRQAARSPGDLILPVEIRTEHITQHSAGFGLREAMRELPQTVGSPDAPIVASMFPDSCRRANFYAPEGYALRCVTAPGLDALLAALAESETVYVLVERAPVGLDPSTLEVPATQVAAYPRPGETAEEASVTLWRVERAPDS